MIDWLCEIKFETDFKQQCNDEMLQNQNIKSLLIAREFVNKRLLLSLHLLQTLQLNRIPIQLRLLLIEIIVQLHHLLLPVLRFTFTLISFSQCSQFLLLNLDSVLVEALVERVHDLVEGDDFSDELHRETLELVGLTVLLGLEDTNVVVLIESDRWGGAGHLFKGCEMNKIAEFKICFVTNVRIQIQPNIVLVQTNKYLYMNHNPLLINKKQSSPKQINNESSINHQSKAITSMVDLIIVINIRNEYFVMYNILQIYLSLFMIQTQLLLLLVLASVSLIFISSLQMTQQRDHISAFEQFKQEFMKTYPSPEQEFYRKLVFTNNLHLIDRHNGDPTQTHKLGLNAFADLTQQEFAHIYLKTSTSSISQGKINTFSNTENDLQVVEYQGDIDWTARGNVSPVRNQGVCGSCWAFSAAQALESTYSIFRNLNVSLSSQQLIDCSTPYGNNGCNGGKIQSAYAYIQDHGLSSEKQYPYVGRSQSCKKDYGDYKIRQYVKVGECSKLYSALQQRPVSVGVDASSWALYKEGILSVCGRNINHGVLLVGVTGNYWKIKNSWGVNWGENGYIRISRGDTCAVCQNPYYPVL